MVAPPGIPSQLGRTRYVEAGRVRIEGRAWSGFGAVERVEFSPDGGKSWEEAHLGGRVGRFGWFGWSHEWEAHAPGEYELCARATDGAGNAQPLDAEEVWNHGTYGINAVQRVPVVVGERGEHQRQD